MRQNVSLPLSEIRQEIHDLTLLRRATGLSPPELELLTELEAKELLNARNNEIVPGQLFIGALIDSLEYYMGNT